MRRWWPIIFAVVVVLLFRLPGILLRRNVEQTLREVVPPNRGSLDSGSKPKADRQETNTNHRPLYQDREIGFSIEFPADWTIKHALSNEPIAIKAVRFGSNNRLAALNIYVLGQADTNKFSQMTPEEWFDEAYGQEATLIASGMDEIGETNAMWIEMHAPKQNDAFSIAYGVASNDKFYLLYGTAVLGGEEWYRDNKPHLLRAIRSFRPSSGAAAQ